MRYIERDYNGLRAECGKMQSAEEKTTFRFAMQNFGFLVENNSRISLSDWADKIERAYSSPQSAECVRIVRGAN